MIEMHDTPAVSADKPAEARANSRALFGAAPVGPRKTERYGIERRVRLEKFFHHLADMPPGLRNQYFAEQNVDLETRREVESLLAFDSGSSTTLQRDIDQIAQRPLDRMELKGTRCRPYELGDLLGRGGMGTLYSAERVDGEISQQVAVKLLRPGADGPLCASDFWESGRS